MMMMMMMMWLPLTEIMYFCWPQFTVAPVSTAAAALIRSTHLLFLLFFVK